MHEHVCTRETCPDGENYYVSAIDGARSYLIAGPYHTHQDSIDAVSKAFDLCNATHPRAWFMSWGTLKLPAANKGVGSLTALGIM